MEVFYLMEGSEEGLVFLGAGAAYYCNRESWRGVQCAAALLGNQTHVRGIYVPRKMRKKYMRHEPREQNKEQPVRKNKSLTTNYANEYTNKENNSRLKSFCGFALFAFFSRDSWRMLCLFHLAVFAGSGKNDTQYPFRKRSIWHNYFSVSFTAAAIFSIFDIFLGFFQNYP